jgi:hypothetical protein
MRVAVIGLDYVSTVTNDLVVIDELPRQRPRHLIDLSGRLGAAVKSPPGCQGLEVNPVPAVIPGSKLRDVEGAGPLATCHPRGRS